jgi:hypothetical protein
VCESHDDDDRCSRRHPPPLHCIIIRHRPWPHALAVDVDVATTFREERSGCSVGQWGDLRRPSRAAVMAASKTGENNEVTDQMGGRDGGGQDEEAKSPSRRDRLTA